MKRILSTIIASVLLVAQVFAQVPAANQITRPQVKQNVITVDKVHPTVLEQLYNMGGLTFFADYSDTENGINADYALGNPMGTFTRTGTAYYTDHTGVMRLAAANTPRITYGVYTESGWTLIDANNKFLIGLMIESAMTNQATYCNTPENAAWTKTNITADNDDPGSTSPDGTATAPSLTASAANATFVQSYAITGAAQTWTSSTFIKAKNITGKVYLAAVEDGTGKSEVTVPNYWVRVQNVATTDGDDAGKDPAFYLELENSGDAVYFWNAQLENNPYMTSPIPSLTTAVARGLDVFTYNILNNFPSMSGPISIFITGAFLTSTGTESGFLYHKGSGDSRAYLYKQITTSRLGTNIVNRIILSTTTIAEKTVLSMGIVSNGSIGKLYKDGIQIGTDTDILTYSGTDPSTFLPGRNSSNVATSIILKDIKIFNRNLSASESLFVGGI